MGSQQSKQNPCQIDPKQWIVLSENIGHKIVKNRVTQEIGQQVVLLVDPLATIQKELKIYNFRKQNKDMGIVCILGAQLLSSNSINLCGNERTMKVIFERIIKLWPSLPQLTLPECIYALNECIVGFKVCFLEQGSFQVTSRMIGVNYQGHIKVWLNQNFAYNHPTIQRPILQTTGDNTANNKNEQEIVQKVIEIIQNKCEQGRFPSDLKSNLLGKQTFDEVHEVLQNYITNNDIYCIDKIHPDSNKMYTLQQQSIPDKQQLQRISPRQRQQRSLESILSTGFNGKNNIYSHNAISFQKSAPKIQNPNIYRHSEYPEYPNHHYETQQVRPKTNSYIISKNNSQSLSNNYYKNPGITIGPIEVRETYISNKNKVQNNSSFQKPITQTKPVTIHHLQSQNNINRHINTNPTISVPFQNKNNPVYSHIVSNPIAYQPRTKAITQLPYIPQQRNQKTQWNIQSSRVKPGFNGAFSYSRF